MLSHTEALIFFHTDFQISESLKNAAQMFKVAFRFIHLSPVSLVGTDQFPSLPPVCSHRLVAASNGHELGFTTVNFFSS